MKANVNALAFQTILLRNPFMGFLDFRAALSDDSPLQWKVEPQVSIGCAIFVFGEVILMAFL